MFVISPNENHLASGLRRHWYQLGYIPFLSSPTPKLGSLLEISLGQRNLKLTRPLSVTILYKIIVPKPLQTTQMLEPFIQPWTIHPGIHESAAPRDSVLGGCYNTVSWAPWSLQGAPEVVFTVRISHLNKQGTQPAFT